MLHRMLHLMVPWLVRAPKSTPVKVGVDYGLPGDETTVVTVTRDQAGRYVILDAHRGGKRTRRAEMFEQWRRDLEADRDRVYSEWPDDKQGEDHHAAP